MVFTPLADRLLKSAPRWAAFSLAANAILLLLLVYIGQRRPPQPQIAQARLASTSTQLLAKTPIPTQPGSDRQGLSYQQWVELLAQEASAAAHNRPDNLMILMGDSITLWFTQDVLPPGPTWLNQGISGKKTLGLLRRLRLIDQTQPQAIFVMIGINDILWDVGDETILANTRLIVENLRQTHPQSRIVVQSILPHAGEKATWEGRDRLLQISNGRIRRLNQDLAALAHREGAIFLNLYPLFANEQGQLKMDLSTDGLHLNRDGYRVWSTALQLFIGLELDPMQITHQYDPPHGY